MSWWTKKQSSPELKVIARLFTANVKAVSVERAKKPLKVRRGLGLLAGDVIKIAAQRGTPRTNDHVIIGMVERGERFELLAGEAILSTRGLQGGDQRKERPASPPIVLLWKRLPDDGYAGTDTARAWLDSGADAPISAPSSPRELKVTWEPLQPIPISGTITIKCLGEVVKTDAISYSELNARCYLYSYRGKPEDYTYTLALDLDGGKTVTWQGGFAPLDPKENKTTEEQEAPLIREALDEWRQKNPSLALELLSYFEVQGWIKKRQSFLVELKKAGITELEPLLRQLSEG